MKFKLGGATIAWLATAAIMYGLAVWITTQITWTSGGTLEHGGAKTSKPPLLVRGFTNPKATQPTLYTGVLVPGDASDAGGYSLSYREDPNGRAGSVLLSYPAGAFPTFVISGLAAPEQEACEALFDFPPGSTAPDSRVAIASFDGGVASLFRVVVKPNEYPGLLSCRVRIASHSDAFTTREMDFKSFDPLSHSYFAVAPDYSSSTDVADQFRGLRHVPELRLNLGVPGAKNLHFSSEHSSVDEDTGETWRIYRAGEGFTIAWDDVYRQQFRDIVLIVIGTLIGIGVTVMIEGLRPVIEKFGGNELGQPRRRVRPRPAPQAPPTQNVQHIDKTVSPTPPSTNSP
jgi:hypothetical protein